MSAQELLSTLVIASVALQLLSIFLFFLLYKISSNKYKKLKKQLDVEESKAADSRADVADLISSQVASAVLDFKNNLNAASAEFINNTSELAKAQLELVGNNLRTKEDEIAAQIDALISKFADATIVEIEDYKKIQIERIKSEADLLVNKVAKEVLSRTLTVAEHEDLVKKALNSAKLNGVFKDNAKK